MSWKRIFKTSSADLRFIRCVIVYLISSVAAIGGMQRYPEILNGVTVLCLILCGGMLTFLYGIRHNKGLEYKRRGVEPQIGQSVKIIHVDTSCPIQDFIGFRIPGLDSMARRVDAVGAIGVVHQVTKYPRIGSVASVYSQSDTTVHLGEFLLNEISEV